MEKEREVVIVSAVRTPFGRYGGSLKDIDYYDLGAIPMKEVLKRVNLEPASGIVGEVFWGVGDTSPCKDPFTPVAARQSLIKAGLPPTTPSISFDMACVSAMHAVKLAAMSIKLGEIDAAIAGGATSFSREPLILRDVRFTGFRIGNINLEDPLFELGYDDFNPVSVDTDNVAFEYGVDRLEQDMLPVCALACYMRALDFGPIGDLQSKYGPSSDLAEVPSSMTTKPAVVFNAMDTKSNLVPYDKSTVLGLMAARPSGLPAVYSAASDVTVIPDGMVSRTTLELKATGKELVHRTSDDNS